MPGTITQADLPNARVELALAREKHVEAVSESASARANASSEQGGQTLRES
jgi:hypothetical protein